MKIAADDASRLRDQVNQPSFAQGRWCGQQSPDRLTIGRERAVFNAPALGFPMYEMLRHHMGSNDFAKDAHIDGAKLSFVKPNQAPASIEKVFQLGERRGQQTQVFVRVSPPWPVFAAAGPARLRFVNRLVYSTTAIISISTIASG